MSESEAPLLDGTTVGILVADRGTEEVEFTEPKEAIAEAGADVDVLGLEDGEAQTVEHDLEESGTYEVDETVADADAYDALVVPGGTVGADNLRSDEDAVELLQEHRADGEPIGSICHGPWALVEADVVDDTMLTSYPSLQTDIENAGGEWVDEEVAVDDGIVTSRDPDDLEAFTDAIVEEFVDATE